MAVGCAAVVVVPIPAASAETFTTFAYGPDDGGVPVARTDQAHYKHCPNPEPGQPFGTATPAEVGLDANSLQSAADFHTKTLQETLFVLRFGCLVFTGNMNQLFDTTPKHQWSVTKAVSAAILGRAVTLGKLSVEDPAGKYLPELDAEHGRVTVRQLLTHTQGTHMNWTREVQLPFNPNRVKEFNKLPFDHEPGTWFDYSQTGPGVLNAIVERAVGRDFQDFAHEELFSKLGIERDHWFWMRDASGWTEGWSNLHMRPLDMVRIGQFWLQGMSWGDRQLVDPGFVADSKRGTEANPGFGYQTWINRAPWYVTVGMPKREVERRPMIASAPQDMFFSWGWRGRHQFMMPNLSMVVVSTPVDHDFSYNPADAHTFPLAQGDLLEGYHEFFRLLMRAVGDQAVRDPGPWTGGTNGPETMDHRHFVEPEHTVASRHGADNADSRGVIMAGQDYGRVAANPEAGPFVPLH